MEEKFIIFLKDKGYTGKRIIRKKIKALKSA